MTPDQIQTKLNEAVMNIQTLQSELDALKTNLSEKPNSCDHYIPQPGEVKDYTHLLPTGYEFCSEEDAEDWVKVELHEIQKKQAPVGFRWEPNTREIDSNYKPYYRPIRKVQYHVAVHEVVTTEPNSYTIEKHGGGWAIYKGRDLMHHGANLGQIFDEQLAYKIAMLLSDKEPEHECTYCGVITSQPDDECYKNPYAVDWSQAPEWAEFHMYDETKSGYFKGWVTRGCFWSSSFAPSGFTLPSGLDWTKSKTTRP